MLFFYIYRDRTSRTYEIYQTSENNLIGTGDGEFFYFACFSRFLDASDYCLRENKK